MANNWILLDTNIVSLILKKNGLSSYYKQQLENRTCCISFVTAGELYFWAQKHNWGSRRKRQLDSSLRNFLVIPYDNEIVRFYGIIRADREKIGRPISDNDCWIAACAMAHDLSILTHNVRDFQDIAGLDVVQDR